MFVVCMEAEHLNAAGIAGDAEHVGAVGRVDGHGVDCAVGAAVRPARSMLTSVTSVPDEVADDDVVGAAERAKLDRSPRRSGPS